MITSINKEDFLEILPISCVESYILASLKKMDYPVEYTYFESFISVQHAFNDYVHHIFNFSYYDGIERIQNIASRLDLLKIKRNKTLSLPVFDQRYMFLFSIKPECLLQSYGKQALRQDHYVYIKQLNEDYLYINNNPLHQKRITRPEIESFYDGEYIRVEFTEKQLEAQDIKNKMVFRICKELDYSWSKYNINDIDLVDISNLFAYLNISWKRTDLLINALFNANLNISQVLNDTILKIAYMKMRNNWDREYITRVFTELDKTQESIKNLLC